ncbi:hypothetical protein K488DRAFT_12331, partial [Vararia minispora EC-137]
MRVKHFIAHVPLVSASCSKLKLFWSRVTATRLTTIYFIFSVAHCFVQAFLQGDAFIVNERAASTLTQIVLLGNSTSSGFYVWQNHQLRYCSSVPNVIDSSSCELVWKATTSASNSSVAAAANSLSDSYSYDASSVAGYAAVAITSVEPTTPSASLAAVPSSLVGPTTVSSSPVIVPSASSALVASQTPVAGSATSSAPPITATVVSTQLIEGKDDNDDILRVILPISRRHFSINVLGVSPNGSLPIVLNGWGNVNDKVFLSTDCLIALNWPVQQLDNTKREDIAFISFQFWVLGMSVVAILNESIPHIIASLLTHLSATAWGAFQLQQTRAFQKDFSTIITNGVCKANLLPTYWTARANVEIPSLVLNCLALVASIFLSWRLIKTFGWQTFKRVGASRTINHVYKLVLTLSVAIQLSLFFVVVSIALWLDQICNGAIGRLATAHKVYEGLLIVVLLMLPVWLTTGWFAVRRELKTPMTIFLALCFGYMVGWGAMFDSTTFRWTIAQWAFFAVMMVVGVTLIIICFIVGIFCRLNFGRGLPHYLNAEEPLPGDDFVRVIPDEKRAQSDPEKIDFPTNFGLVPTYETAYGFDDDMPPPPGARTLGPRF